LKEYLKDANLVTEKLPPKLLIGDILDMTGTGKFLPKELYHYLAIRNPYVRFYNVIPDNKAN